MNFFKKLLNRVIYPTALIYTVISVITLFGFFFWGEKETKNTAVLFFLIAGYALIAALTSCIFYTEIILPIKFSVHFGVLFIIFWIAVANIFKTTYYIPLIAFVVIYLAVAIPCTSAYKRKKKEQMDKKEYKKMFSR